ncbi:MAG: hypothetical protein AB7O24_13980 [Kofleriaceae bacterium]
MEVLSAARVLGVLAGMTACYSPALPECVVACSSDDDCAPDQRCDSSRLCAALERTAACSAAPPVDAQPLDARLEGTVDAAPDATPVFELRIAIDGLGTVVVADHGTCTPAGSECVYAVATGAQIMLFAQPLPGWALMRWHGGACDHQGATCTVTASRPLRITAKFKPG